MGLLNDMVDTVVYMFSIHPSFYTKRTLNFPQMSDLISQLCPVYFRRGLIQTDLMQLW